MTKLLLSSLACVAVAAVCRGQNAAPPPSAPAGIKDSAAETTGDDTATILAAVAACRGTAQPVLNLEPRTYHFSQDKIPPNKRLFSLEGVDGLTIDGHGATLLFEGDVTPFYFTKCHGVTLKNVTVDWPRPPFSQGKAIAATDNSIDIQVDPAYPVTGQEKIEGMMDYDAATHLPLANLDIFGSMIASTQLIAPQTLRIVFQTRHNPPKMAHLKKYLAADVGKLFVLRHRVYGQYGIDIDRCSDVRLENISIYTVPGMGIHAGDTENITCKHVEVRIKPGSGRLMSTTADCQYYTFCKGTIDLEDGYYENNGDDGLNITEKYRLVRRLSGPTSLAAGLPTKLGWLGPLPSAGEKLVFCDGTTMEPHGEAVVRSAKLDLPQRQFEIEFAGPLPPTIKEGDLFYSGTYLPRAIVRHCTFRGQRSRSMLFSTRDILVEDCTVEGSGYCGIFFKGGERHGAEGPMSEAVTIRRCTFDGCGGAAIYAYGAMNKPDRVLAAATSGYVFEGNTIRQNPALAAQRFARDYPLWMHWSAGIAVRACHDLKILDNTFQGYPVAVFLDNVRNAQVVSNRADHAMPLVMTKGTVQQITADRNSQMPMQDSVTGTKPDLEYLNDFR